MIVVWPSSTLFWPFGNAQGIERGAMVASVILMLLIVIGNASVLATSRQVSRCKSCVNLADEVEKRLESTAKKGGQVTVGHRFGPNGESVHKKIIDYVDSYHIIPVFCHYCQ